MERMHELARDLGLKQGFLWPDAWMQFLKFTLADKFGVEWSPTCGNKFNIKRDDYVRHFIMFDEEEEAQAGVAASCGGRGQSRDCDCPSCLLSLVQRNKLIFLRKYSDPSPRRRVEEPR